MRPFDSSRKELLCLLIPAYNEAKVIEAGIWSAVKSGFLPRDIFVVDDGSKDDTSRVVQSLGANVLRVPNAGRAEALNSGIRDFHLPDRYEYVACMDADTQMGPDYRTVMVDAIKKNPTFSAFAGTPQSIRHNWITAYRVLEYAVSCGIYKEAQNLFRSITVCPGPASVYKTTIFEKLGFSSKTLAEDMDITIAMERAGHRIAYVADAIVHTQDPPTIRTYIGQVSRWQRGAWQNVRKHRLGRKRQPIDFEFGYLCFEGLFFAVSVAMMPLWIWWYPHGAIFAAAIDQGLLFSLAMLVALRQRRWDVLVAFPLFSIPRFLNSLLFGWMFISERRPKETKWFSVERY